MGKQARFLKSELEDGVNKAAATTGKRAVFMVAFLAVVREGIELAIFVTAAFFAGNQEAASTTLIQILVGTILGLGTAVLLGYTIFATTVRLDLRKFFQVTGILLILFAAGLVAQKHPTKMRLPCLRRQSNLTRGMASPMRDWRTR
jgi:high-affinity iron transporter